MDMYIYQATLFACFLFWGLFDTISNILLKHRISDNPERFLTRNKDSLRAMQLHFALKFLFYIACVVCLFKMESMNVIISFIGFFVGTKLSVKNNSVDEMVLNDDKKEIDKSFVYGSISFVSMIVFTVSLFVL